MGIPRDFRRAVESIMRSSSPVCCRVYNSGNFLHDSNGNFLPITFDSERYDTYNMHSLLANTDRITISAPGKYHIFGNIEFASNSTGRRGMSIRLNGTTDIALRTQNAGAASTTVMSIDTEYNLVAGDYLTLTAYQTSGGNLNVDAVGNFSPEFGASRIA